MRPTFATSRVMSFCPYILLGVIILASSVNGAAAEPDCDKFEASIIEFGRTLSERESRLNETFQSWIDAVASNDNQQNKDEIVRSHAELCNQRRSQSEEIDKLKALVDQDATHCLDVSGSTEILMEMRIRYWRDHPIDIFPENGGYTTGAILSTDVGCAK